MPSGYSLPEIAFLNAEALVRRAAPDFQPRLPLELEDCEGLVITLPRRATSVKTTAEELFQTMKALKPVSLSWHCGR